MWIKLQQNRDNWLPVIGWVAFILGMGMLGFLVVAFPAIYVLAAVGGILAVFVLGIQPELTLVGLLLLRSSADAFQNLFTFLPDSIIGFNAAGLLNIAMVGLGVIILFRRFGRGEPLLPLGAMKAYGAFLLVSLVGFAVSVDLTLSIKAWTRLASYLGVGLLTIEVLAKNKDATLTLLRVLTIAAVPPILLGYYQAITGTGFVFEGYLGTDFAFRPQGTFGHPAILATFLIMIIALILVAFIENYPLWPRGVLLAIAGFSTVLLVMTYARTQWLGLLAVLVVIGVVRYRRILVLGAAAVGLVVLTVPTIQERLWGGQASESVLWRLDIWEASIDLLTPPTLFGEGLDTSQILINDVLVNVFSPPHNEYLRTAIETGVVGALLYIATLVFLVSRGWKAYTEGNPGQRVVGLALFAFMIGGAVISVSDNFLSYVSVQWYIWFLVGLLIDLPLRDTVKQDPGVRY